MSLTPSFVNGMIGNSGEEHALVVDMCTRGKKEAQNSQKSVELGHAPEDVDWPWHRIASPNHSTVTAQSQHSHSTVTAQSQRVDRAWHRSASAHQTQHSHSTITAQSQHSHSTVTAHVSAANCQHRTTECCNNVVTML